MIGSENETVLMKAGFNKAYWYHTIDMNSHVSRDMELFCNFSKKDWIFRNPDPKSVTRFFKLRLAPALDLNRQNVSFDYLAITPQLLHMVIETALTRGFILELDDVLFALKTMVWYSAQRILAFWGPRFYCVFRLVNGNWEVVDLRDIIRRSPYGEPGRR